MNSFADNIDHSPDGSPGGGSRQLHRQLSSGLSAVSTDVRILLVWLESYEDFQNFPFEEIFSGISPMEGGGGATPGGASGSSVAQHYKESFTIFIHELKSGLLRINLKTHGMRYQAHVCVNVSSVYIHLLALFSFSLIEY